jgi:hypothetical protein
MCPLCLDFFVRTTSPTKNDTPSPSQHWIKSTLLLCSIATSTEISFTIQCGIYSVFHLPVTASQLHRKVQTKFWFHCLKNCLYTNGMGEMMTSPCRQLRRSPSSTRRCRCSGISLLVIQFSSCTLLEVFIVKIFWNTIVYPQTKLWGTKTGLINSVVRQTSYYIKPYWINKNGLRKRHSSGIIVLYLTILKSTPPKVKKEE